MNSAKTRNLYVVSLLVCALGLAAFLVPVHKPALHDTLSPTGTNPPSDNQLLTSPAWQNWLSDLIAEEVEAPPPAPPFVEPASRLEWSLQGIVVADGAALIIIAKDGKHLFLRQGQEVDGFRLMTINADTATFEANGERTMLILQGAS